MGRGESNATEVEIRVDVLHFKTIEGVRRANESLIVLQQTTYRDSPVPVEGHADVANRDVSGCVRDDHYAQGSHHRDRCDRVLHVLRIAVEHVVVIGVDGRRSEEHTSELQSLMRISYAVFCLKKNKK